MPSLKKDWLLLLMGLLPFLYAIYVWQDLPHEVPMQWDLDGNPNKYVAKIDLAVIVFSMPAVTYFVFWLIAYLDYKEKKQRPTIRFNAFKNVAIILTSALGLYIVNASVRGGLASTNWIVLMAGVLYMLLGSYLKAVPANYFLGIRTPWTLKNELVWERTHSFAGRLWLLVGLGLMIVSFWLAADLNVIILIGSTLFILLLPTLYSFIKYRAMNRSFS